MQLNKKLPLLNLQTYSYKIKQCLKYLLLASLFFSPLGFAATQSQTEINNSAENGVVEKQLDAIEIEQTQLIEHALKYDYFGQRCRGSSLTKYFNKTNRLFLSKYGFTANNYIKDYINPEVDEYKSALKQAFLKTLIQSGDCKGARELNWRKQMNDDFNRLYEDVENSVWFPE